MTMQVEAEVGETWVTCGHIKRTLCAIADIPSWYMTAHCRNNTDWMFVRQVAMTLASEMTGRSLTFVGQQFGGRDHSTVLHARQRVEDAVRSDEVAAAFVDHARKAVRSESRSRYTAPVRAQAALAQAISSEEETKFFGGRLVTTRTGLVVDGIALSVTAAQARLLLSLLKAEGRVVTPDGLSDVIGAAYTPSAMSDFVCRLRGRIERQRVPIALHTVRGRGYALTLAGDMPATDAFVMPPPPAKRAVANAAVRIIDPRVLRLRRMNWSVKAIARHLAMDEHAVASDLGVEWGCVA